MAFPWRGSARPVGIINKAGDKQVDVVTDGGGVNRLAVDLGGATVTLGAVELEDGGAGTEEAQIRADAQPFGAPGAQGGLLIAGRDNTGPTHRHLRCNALGQLEVDIVGGDIQIGAVELKNASSATRNLIEDDAVAFPGPAADKGGLLIAGRDDTGPTLRHIRVDASGRLQVGGLITDTDDDDVDPNQVPLLVLNLTYAFNPTTAKWERVHSDEENRMLIAMGSMPQGQTVETTTPLGASGSFTSSVHDMVRQESFGVSVFLTGGASDSDVDVFFEHSFDNITWRVYDSVNIPLPAGTDANLDRIYGATRRYQRVRLVNNQAVVLAVTEVGFMEKPTS